MEFPKYGFCNWTKAVWYASFDHETCTAECFKNKSLSYMADVSCDVMCNLQARTVLLGDFPEFWLVQWGSQIADCFCSQCLVKTSQRYHFWKFLLHMKVLATESPLKSMKIAFYFTSKALFVLKIFKCLSWLYGHLAKRLDQKDTFDFKFYDVAS